MQVSVRLFAVLRERAGRDSVELALADGATVADALEALRVEAGLDELLARLPVRMAVNRDYASLETKLAQVIEGVAEDRQQPVNPKVRPLLTQAEEFAHENLRGICFEIDENEQ